PAACLPPRTGSVERVGMRGQASIPAHDTCVGGREDHRAERDPVPRERHEIVMTDVTDQPTHDSERRDERGRASPDRELPGINASACAQPINSASVHRIASTVVMRTAPGRVRARRSAQMMTKAPTTNAHATGTGAKRYDLIARLKTRPSTAAGRKAINRLTAKRF